jgi:hypothetical protein
LRPQTMRKMHRLCGKCTDCEENAQTVWKIHRL